MVPTVKDLNSYSTHIADYPFYKKISNSIPGNQITIVTFLNPNYNLAFGQTTTGDEVFALNQINNSYIIFTLGNPELYLKRNTQITEKELFYYNSLIPINIWKKNGKEYTIKNFTEHYKIKHFYFNAGIQIPEFILKNINVLIESPITHNKFIILK